MDDNMKTIAKNLAEKICYLHGNLHPNDIIPDIKLALSLHSQKIREEVEERRHTAQNCECEGFGCPRNSTIEDILKIKELTPPTNL